MITSQTVKHKTRRAINEPGDAHEFTFSCYRRFPFFESDDVKIEFLRSLSTARQRYGFKIWAYVIMPNHVHLLIHPDSDEYDVSAILKSIKQPVARRVADEWRSSGNLMVEMLNNGRIDRKVNHFWQPGGGYDRNLTSSKAIWNAIEYIHENPVRRYLVKYPTDWRWSSARFYSGVSCEEIEEDQCDV